MLFTIYVYACTCVLIIIIILTYCAQGHYSVFQNVGILGDKVLECREFVTFFIQVMTTS